MHGDLIVCILDIGGDQMIAWLHHCTQVLVCAFHRELRMRQVTIGPAHVHVQPCLPFTVLTPLQWIANAHLLGLHFDITTIGTVPLVFVVDKCDMIIVRLVVIKQQVIRFEW